MGCVIFVKQEKINRKNKCECFQNPWKITFLQEGCNF